MTTGRAKEELPCSLVHDCRVSALPGRFVLGQPLLLHGTEPRFFAHAAGCFCACFLEPSILSFLLHKYLGNKKLKKKVGFGIGGSLCTLGRRLNHRQHQYFQVNDEFSLNITA